MIRMPRALFGLRVLNQSRFGTETTTFSPSMQ
jgi:hypothetical protein